MGCEWACCSRVAGFSKYKKFRGESKHITGMSGGWKEGEESGWRKTRKDGRNRGRKGSGENKCLEVEERGLWSGEWGVYSVKDERSGKPCVI